MFEFFKWKKKERFDYIGFIEKVVDILPDHYEYLKRQFHDGLLKYASESSRIIPNYVGFTYNPLISKKYSDDLGSGFKLKGIELICSSQPRPVLMTINVIEGLIVGYSMSAKVRESDIEKITVGTLREIPMENSEFDSIKHLFNKNELALINRSDVYEVELMGKTYFHLRELGDGDFIGIDAAKNIFKITHDPFEVVQLNEDLLQVLQSVSPGQHP